MPFSLKAPAYIWGYIAANMEAFQGLKDFVWLNSLVSRDYLRVQDLSVKDSYVYAVATAGGVAYQIDVVGENQSAVRLMGRDTFACTNTDR